VQAFAYPSKFGAVDAPVAFLPRSHAGKSDRPLSVLAAEDEQVFTPVVRIEAGAGTVAERKMSAQTSDILRQLFPLSFDAQTVDLAAGLPPAAYTRCSSRKRTAATPPIDPLALVRQDWPPDSV
jgi:hypothetical protein